LLLVGTYRDDEKPDLADELPAMQVLTLEPFPQERVAELSEAVLGAAGREPRVVDLLQRESLGNPLFLIEAVRSLAEKTGQLAQISSQSLPDVVLVYEAQVRRRLECIPREARPLLNLAAVGGRQLDLGLLRACEPDADLERWLLTLADAAVLEAQEDGWRFSHDMVREAILDHIAEEARPGLHRRVAEALESLYPDALDRMPALAHHWGLAGDVAKERQYAELAGVQALQMGAYDEAIPWLEKALDLHDVETISPLELATLRRRLGQAYYGQGKLAESRQHSMEALTILGRPLPATSRGLTVDLLQQLGRQVLHRLWPDHYLGRSKQTEETLREIAQAGDTLAEVAYFNNETVLAINLCLWGLNRAEAVGASPELARAYAHIGFLASLSPLHFLADDYVRRAQEIAQDLEDLPTQAIVWFLAGIVDLVTCRWHRSRSMLEQAIEIARQLGDRKRLGQYLSLLGNVFYYRGLFGRSAEVWAEIDALASRRNDAHQQGWSSTWQAVFAMRSAPEGYLDKAITHAEKAAQLLAGQAARADELYNDGILALVYLRRGDEQRAWEMAAKTTRTLAQEPSLALQLFEGCAGVAEVCLTLWETGGVSLSVDDKTLAHMAGQATKALRNYARNVMYGRPRAYLWQGLYHWLAGKPRRAHKLWQKALAQARALEMPYEQGLAYYQIGRHLVVNDPAREEHLGRAAELFRQLQAAYDLARVQAAREGGSGD
jgi:tetratricopeptide (TPR) repeat protein